MKGQKDEIKKLFDDYAEDLTPRQDLASKAKAFMSVKNSNKQKAQGNKQSANGRFKWIASFACAFVVLIISVGIVLPLINGNGINTPSNDEHTQPPAPGQNAQTEETDKTIVYYTLSDVKGKTVALSEVDNALQISRLHNSSNYQVVSERYYAFYTDDGDLAYIKALLGVRTDDGFAEITLIAEVNGMVRDDLKGIYSQYHGIYDNDLISSTELDKNGEYVTQGYFSARNMHFYVYAETGANSWLSEQIISNLL